MKKIITIITLLAIAITLLTGCGNNVTCDFCAEEKKCETKTVLGEEVNICKDCIAELNELA